MIYIITQTTLEQGLFLNLTGKLIDYKKLFLVKTHLLANPDVIYI